jgi:hypothetical protein
MHLNKIIITLFFSLLLNVLQAQQQVAKIDVQHYNFNITINNNNNKIDAVATINLNTLTAGNINLNFDAISSPAATGMLVSTLLLNEQPATFNINKYFSSGQPKLYHKNSLQWSAC